MILPFYYNVNPKQPPRLSAFSAVGSDWQSDFDSNPDFDFEYLATNY